MGAQVTVDGPVRLWRVHQGCSSTLARRLCWLYKVLSIGMQQAWGRYGVVAGPGHGLLVSELTSGVLKL